MKVKDEGKPTMTWLEIKFCYLNSHKTTVFLVFKFNFTAAAVAVAEEEKCAPLLIDLIIFLTSM